MMSDMCRADSIAWSRGAVGSVDAQTPRNMWHRGRPRDPEMRLRLWRRQCEGIGCTFLPHMSRLQLPKLLEKLRFAGQSAEVGVWRGAFSARLLDKWRQGGHHYMVDPYLRFDAACSKHLAKGGDKQCRHTQQYFDQVFANTSGLMMEKHPGRVTILRNLSISASASFRSASLAFVYVDARHDYHGVLEDLEAWWRVLGHGGLFAGHDYTDAVTAQAALDTRIAGGKPHKTPVADAVRDFLTGLVSRGQLGEPRPTLYITADHPASWFLFKPCRAGMSPALRE